MANYLGKGAPSNGSVYVCNLPLGTDENMLAEYFGTIGLLKKDKRTGQPKIWLYRDKETMEPKGDCTVTYEDPYAAQAAVEWFNKKDFHGATIEVFMAESKNSSKSGVEDPSLGNDFGGLEGSMTDANGSGGRGRGRGDALGKSWQQDGDWMCPNTSCSNVNFAFRGVCNRCGSARPAGASGGGGGAGGRGRGRGGNDTSGSRSVGGPAGLFGPNDWPCPMCGNINWAKRLKCNICNTNKPGVSEGGMRGGRGGGYKELDEEEIEETKRRRREAEEDDGEMYDEFGNLKKKFRAKAQQTEASQLLPGVGRAGWEVEELETSQKLEYRLHNVRWRCLQRAHVVLVCNNEGVTKMVEIEAEKGTEREMNERAARTENVKTGTDARAEVGTETGIGEGIETVRERENMAVAVAVTVTVTVTITIIEFCNSWFVLFFV